MKTKNLIIRIAAIIAAIILLQTLYFKFTAHPDSVFIFSQLGIEPYGRIGVGIMELATGILLIIPRTTLVGAVLGLGVIAGAIGAHLFILGLEVQNDGGQLFGLAVVVLICCTIIVWLKKCDIAAIKAIIFR
jgi:hypothetical protein